MTHRQLEFHPDAAEEAEAALLWYADRSRIAAKAFLDELDQAIGHISAHPKRWPVHVHGTRRFLMRRFPFLVIYREHHGKIQIVAVAHARRRPGYWQSRTDV